MDTRTRRTTIALAHALIQLIQESGRFDDITVRQILQRAGVGRTTFYSHFRKEDVLHSTYEGIFGGHKEQLRQDTSAKPRLFPVGEFLEHLDAESRDDILFIYRFDEDAPRLRLGNAGAIVPDAAEQLDLVGDDRPGAAAASFDNEVLKVFWRNYARVPRSIVRDQFVNTISGGAHRSARLDRDRATLRRTHQRSAPGSSLIIS